MPIIRLIPQTCADAILSQTVQGDCLSFNQFSNLVPAPDNPGQLVPRPAAIKYANSDKGVTITSASIYGNYIFGWMNDPAASVYDVPYIFDILNSAYLTITGVATSGASRNTPTSTVAGAWIPPHAEMIGNVVILTHFGFDGGAGPPARYFGVLTAPGNQVQGQVNQPPHAFVTWEGPASWQLDISQKYPTGGTFTLVYSDSTGVNVTTAAIAYNATATAVMNALNAAGGAGTCTAASGGPMAIAPVALTLAYFAYGGWSNLAVGTSSFTGGGKTVSGWVTSGSWSYTCQNTTTNPLPSAPVWCSEFNSRAYYVCNPGGTTPPGVLLSDNIGSGGATSRSSAVQGVIFTFGDNIPLVCAKKLSLTTMIGTITSALYVFKQANMGRPNIFQITGDPATNNVDVQPMNTNVSTTSPNSLCQSPKGLFFMASDGGRYVDYNGQIQQPIGYAGTGITIPFVYTADPVKISADSNGSIIAITTQNTLVAGSPYQIWVADIVRQMWHGPHTFPAGLIQAWGQNFIMTPAAGHGYGFYLLSFIPSITDTYVELGSPLSCTYQSALFPDRRELTLLTCHKHYLQLGLLSGNNFNVAITDGAGATLESATLTANGQEILGRYEVPWTQPMTSDYFGLTITVNSALGLRLGIYEIEYVETAEGVRPTQ